MDHGNESGGVYAAEKIIKKRYRKVNENHDKTNRHNQFHLVAQSIES